MSDREAFEAWMHQDSAGEYRELMTPAEIDEQYRLWQAAWNALQPPAPAPIPTVCLDGIPKRVVLWGEVPTECVRTSDISSLQMFDADKLADEIDDIAYDYMSTNEQNAFMRRVKELLTARLKGGAE